MTSSPTVERAGALAPHRPAGLAVVTGGTRGVGLATATRLAAAGHPVLLVYGSDATSASDAEQLLRRAGADVSTVRADLAAGGVEAVLQAVAARGERLGVLVHNASGFRPSPTLGTSFAHFCDEAAVALGPLLDGAAAIADAMAGGPGRIVAVSSLGAGRAVPGYAGLGPAKAALESLVRYLAVELAPRGIAINAVSTAKIDKSGGAPLPPPVQQLAQRTPAGRLTTDDDVADTVALLCSPLAHWVHGQTLVADGGLSLRV